MELTTVIFLYLSIQPSAALIDSLMVISSDSGGRVKSLLDERGGKVARILSKEENKKNKHL